LYQNTLYVFDCKATKNNDTMYKKRRKLSVATENHDFADVTRKVFPTQKGT